MYRAEILKMSEKFLAEIQQLKDERKKLTSDSGSAVAVMRRECDLEVEELQKTLDFYKQLLKGKESENEAFAAKIRQLDQANYEQDEIIKRLQSQLERQYLELTDNFNRQTEKMVEEHEREVYELRGAKKTIEIQYEELKKALAKRGGSENQYRAELEKVKSAWERDIAKYQLKISALKEKVEDKDQQLKDMTEKLKQMAKNASKLSNMEAYIEKLER